ncbi:MAG: hypothetical protein AVDCRST_MAG11-307 [uncultured Gemmatimonadaceae bacterium]|uniref:Uncharacterized protein n=1 Tax=uncultured Gemmatimonadaceae bacterium TaxID=246130 RepID=A0A6J4K1W5_9BACT|nr:MAG: hypothetical protein AVDCRST_MAG11-307 [uncultured Gemmatimonadaceae bacterium]
MVHGRPGRTRKAPRRPPAGRRADHDRRRRAALFAAGRLWTTGS